MSHYFFVTTCVNSTAEDINNLVENSEEIRNKFLTYFLLFFPTIIIVAIPGTIDGDFIPSLSLKVLLAFYQFVTLKTFIDKHYE